MCVGWLKHYNVSTKGKVEEPLLQGVHRVRDPNNQRLFECFPQGVRVGILLGRFEFASKILGGITPLNTSKEDGDQKTSNADGG